MKRRICNDDTDLQRAIVFQRNIEVWIQCELETVGKVKSFTEDTVVLEDGSHYLRMNCQLLMK